MKSPDRQKLLVIVLGLPGTGKTTFAKSFASRIGAVHLSSDYLRHLSGKRGQYDKNSKSSVYEALYDEAKKMLAQNKDVVVDATFSEARWRTSFALLKDDFSVSVHFIEVKAAEKVIRERVSKKREYSDADFSVYLKIRDNFEPLGGKYLALWSDNLTLDEMIQKALVYLNKPV